ncbi:MAG: DUF2683 family protein [archaeon]|nr:DUF2683 family protein [archaeon]
MSKTRTVTINAKINDYTNRVIGVVKEKYGLKDKGEALDKFAEIYGDEEVDREVKDEVIREMIEISDRHMKKYGFKTTTIAQLRKEIEGK